jgi:hypothetical protein
MAPQDAEHSISVRVTTTLRATQAPTELVGRAEVDVLDRSPPT